MLRQLALLLSLGVALFLTSGRPTAAQQSGIPITVANAAQVLQSRMLGRGAQVVFPIGERVSWLPDSRRLAAATDAGVWIFDASSPDAPSYLISKANDGITLSPDGNFIASILYDLDNSRTVILRVADGSEALSLKYKGYVESLAFSPDGKLLVVGGVQGNSDTQVWDIAAQKLLITLPTGDVSNVQFVAGGKWLATQGYPNIQFWDTKTWRLYRTLTGTSGSDIAFTPDASIIIGKGSNAVWITGWRGRIAALGTTDWLHSFALSPDGALVAVASQDDERAVLLWKVRGGGVEKYLKGHTDKVAYLQYSPDGKTLATISLDGIVRLWDVSSGQVRVRLQTEDADVRELRFSPDSKRIAGTTNRGQLVVWDAETGNAVATWNDFYGWVNTMALSPDGMTIATGTQIEGALWSTSRNRGGTHEIVLLWDTGTAKPRAKLEGNARDSYITKVAFSGNGSLLASSSRGGTVRLWEPSTGKLLKTLQQGATIGDFAIVALNEDGKLLATSGYGDYPNAEIGLWDTTGGQSGTVLAGGTDQVQHMVFSPDGKTLAAAYGGSGCGFGNRTNELMDRSVRLWDIQTSKVRLTLNGHTDAVYGVAYSRDGKLLASSDRAGNIILWDSTSGEQLRQFPNRYEVCSVAFNPDGTMLASGGAEGVQLWDVASGKLLATLSGHSRTVTSVIFKRDGSTLVSGSWDGTVRLWEIKQ